MITVKIVRDTKRRITGMFMKGHAGYARHGKDIVCSSASTLIYTLANSIETICGVAAEDISRIVPGNDVMAEVIIPYDRIKDEGGKDRASVVAETIYTGFITLASATNSNGKKYIEVKEETEKHTEV
ncbi:MAG: ribosomal-processing cysteine protease Prp [Clostridiales bacterium]|nr:ribosomal-processing cysteine protease Prp [Clostridiales bacterium]